MLQRILPFIFLGIMVVVFAVGIVVLSYLLIIGAIVGMILFLIAWIKEKISPSVKHEKEKKSGRVIDHER